LGGSADARSGGHFYGDRTVSVLSYRLLYRLGITPWEQMARLPVAEQIAALFEREEAGREPPYGPALDLGCGSGIWAVELAKRGWEVTGVDFVPRALRRARERAAEAGVDVRLIEGDVTTLSGDGVDSGFRLLVDFGCFHDELTPAQRVAEGREATALAAPGAVLLMMAWQPGNRGPFPRGAGREEIEAAFPAWDVTDEQPFDTTGAPGYVDRADPRFYRLSLGERAGASSAGRTP
jgi:SAM-dependent methyltransferase